MNASAKYLVLLMTVLACAPSKQLQASGEGSFGDDLRSALSQELIMMKAQVQDLNRSLHEAHKLQAKHLHEMQQMQERHGKQEEVMRARNEKMVGQLREVSSAQSNAKKTIAELSKEKKALSQQLNVLYSKIEALEKEKEQRGVSLAEHKQANQALVAHVQSLKKELEGMRAQSMALQDKITKEHQKVVSAHDAMVERCNKMEAEHAQLKSTLAHTKNEANGMQQVYDREIKEARSYIEACNREQELANKKLAAANKKISELQDSSKAVQDMKVQHRQMTEEHTALLKEFDALSQQHVALQKRYQPMKSDLARMSKEKELVNNEYVKLSSQYEKLVEQYAAMNEKYEPLKVAYEKASKESGMMQKELVQAQKISQDLDKKLAEMSRECAAAKQQLMCARQECEMLAKERKNEMMCWEKEKSTLSQSLQKSVAECDRVSKKLASINQKYQPLKQDNKDMMRECSALHRELDAACKTNQDMTQRLAAMTEDCTNVRSELQCRLQECAQLKKQHLAENEVMRKERASMQKELTSFEQKNSDLTKKLADVSADCSTTKEQLRHAMNECSKLTKEHGALTGRVTELSTLAMKLKGQLDEQMTLNEEQRRFCVQVRELSNQCALAQKTIEDYQRVCASLSNDNEALVARIAGYESCTDKACKQVAHALQRHENEMVALKMTKDAYDSQLAHCEALQASKELPNMLADVTALTEQIQNLKQAYLKEQEENKARAQQIQAAARQGVTKGEAVILSYAEAEEDPRITTAQKYARMLEHMRVAANEKIKRGQEWQGALKDQLARLQKVTKGLAELPNHDAAIAQKMTQLAQEKGAKSLHQAWSSPQTAKKNGVRSCAVGKAKDKSMARGQDEEPVVRRRRSLWRSLACAE